jgi:hypothetical protein
MAANHPVMTNAGPQFSTAGHHGNLEVVDIDVDTLMATFQVRFADGSLGGPYTTVPIWRINPTSPEDTQKFWRLFVEKLIARLKQEGRVPAEYKGFLSTQEEDSTGDPALYVSILVDPQISPSEIKVTEWSNFLRLARERLIASGMQRWPYLNLGDAARERNVTSR